MRGLRVWRLRWTLLQTAIQQRQLEPSLLACANELAGRLDCDRVSIGFEKSGSTEVHAISHYRHVSMPRWTLPG